MASEVSPGRKSPTGLMTPPAAAVRPVEEPGKVEIRLGKNWAADSQKEESQAKLHAKRGS